MQKAYTPTKALTSLRKKQKARINNVEAGSSATRRILDLGLCPGTLIQVTSIAPFQGPVEVRVRGTTVALGRGIAEKILVDPVEEEPRNARSRA